MREERIAWHPGFASAMQLELMAYRDSLVFETEHELNRQPLRIDLLVIKKDEGVRIDDDIASAFRGHNVLEFKSERDGLTIDDLCKTLAYALLYKAYGGSVDAIGLDDVTVTIARHRMPSHLVQVLAEHGFGVSERARGIYSVAGLVFPVQLVITSQIDPREHIWLSSLAAGVVEPQLRELIEAARSIKDEQGRELARSVLSVVTQANNDTVEAMSEEEDMYKTLYEILQPRIDKDIQKAREEARVEGAIQGMTEGMKEGMKQGTTEGRKDAIRGVVGRLIARGGYTEEDISDITGTPVDDVRAIIEDLRATA